MKTSSEDLSYTR